MAIQWDQTRAAHLYRRAGFGATREEIDQAVAEGLEATVDRLLEFTTDSALESRLAALQLDLTQPAGIAQWWTARLLWTANPLQERMTLFLHDHFATAISKVASAPAMLTQNQLLRGYALGNFSDLTVEAARDPAMLLWLDNFTNVKDHPNENFGRELLELFLLGNGNYTEDDVLAASRAFTGWTLSRPDRQFVFIDRLHDHSQKTFLGRTGDWDGDDIVRMACGEMAHARFLTAKLYAFLVHDHIDDSRLDAFATIYLQSGNELRPLVRAILTDAIFYDDHILWSTVKAPADHVVQAVRQLRIDDDRILRHAGTSMTLGGQTLFNPPDVAGWDGGMSWINSASLLTRMNFVAPILGVFDPARFIGNEPWSSAADVVDIYLRRLGPLTVDQPTRAALESYVAPGGSMPGGNALQARLRGLAQLVTALPQWQLN